MRNWTGLNWMLLPFAIISVLYITWKISEGLAYLAQAERPSISIISTKVRTPGGIDGREKAWLEAEEGQQ